GQREVIVLHKLQGMSMEDVAEKLGIGLSATKVRAHRGYKQLRDIIEEELQN
ncbi:MAG: RNA polymerase sigma factor, partial [Myxococcales bacterium]|nr:RNA polymerase sigma factor [Myxococcales bacterium]